MLERHCVRLSMGRCSRCAGQFVAVIASWQYAGAAAAATSAQHCVSSREGSSGLRPARCCGCWSTCRIGGMFRPVGRPSRRPKAQQDGRFPACLRLLAGSPRAKLNARSHYAPPVRGRLAISPPFPRPIPKANRPRTSPAPFLYQ